MTMAATTSHPTQTASAAVYEPDQSRIAPRRPGPSIFRGVRAMWTGLDASGLVDAKLVALINRRVAAMNGCEF